MNNMGNNSGPVNKITLPVITSASSCGCTTLEETPHHPPRLDQSFVVGFIPTPAGDVPQVAAQLNWTDHRGTIRARFGVGRMDYMIDPGLYALGNPDNTSPVMVTANYKMSFDYLRRELSGRNVWI
jgi:acetyl-CoA decarbonylase/synthase complex subunit gamma